MKGREGTDCCPPEKNMAGKSKNISISLTEDEYRKLAGKAGKYGMEPNEYAAFLIGFPREPIKNAVEKVLNETSVGDEFELKQIKTLYEGLSVAEKLTLGRRFLKYVKEHDCGIESVTEKRKATAYRRTR